MTTLNINPEIKKQIAREVGAEAHKKRAKRMLCKKAVDTKLRVDKLDYKREIDLINHHDKLYYESLLD